jgi:hypothetical protein
MADFHVVPIGDIKPHIEEGVTCWCKPYRHEEAPSVVVHNSMDRREEYEQRRKLQ